MLTKAFALKLTLSLRLRLRLRLVLMLALALVLTCVSFANTASPGQGLPVICIDALQSKRSSDPIDHALQVCNLGDSGFNIFRDAQCVFESEVSSSAPTFLPLPPTVHYAYERT